MITTTYGSVSRSLMAGQVNYLADTVMVALCSSLYVPDPALHEFFSQVTNEVTGIGYTAGGQALASKTSTYLAADRTLVLAAANPVWPASTITARYAVFYDLKGTPATSPLLCVWNFEADVASVGGDFTVTIGTGGLLRLTTTAPATAV